MDKSEQLRKLKAEMEKDSNLPLRKEATQLVFGEGNPDAKIYFLGEAPGFYEDQQGRPFVGAAGKLLDEEMQKNGLMEKTNEVYPSSEARRRSSAYISNVVRFRPPNNRDPLPEEIAAFAPHVDKEIEIVNPKLIITLGRFSMGKFMPYEKISIVHGKPRKSRFKGKDIWVLPMFHPAAALRNPDMMDKFTEDFKKIPQILAKIIEESTSKPSQGSLF